MINKLGIVGGLAVLLGLAACSSSTKADPQLPPASDGTSSTTSNPATATCATFAGADVARIAHLTGPVSSQSKAGESVVSTTTCAYTAADGADKATITLLGTNREFFDAVHQANLDDKSMGCVDLPDLGETAYGCTVNTYYTHAYRHDLAVDVQIEHADQARDKADTLALTKFVLTKV